MNKILFQASQPKSDGQKEKTQTEQSKMQDSHKESSKEKSETQDSKLKKNAESKYDKWECDTTLNKNIVLATRECL